MTKRYIFAGFGGQGMLLIGKFVAMANMLEGKHVSTNGWYSSNIWSSPLGIGPEIINGVRASSINTESTSSMLVK